jgi:predicted CoA-binding protein
VSIRNLDRVFNPRRVALIGASSRPGAVGKVLLDNLVAAGPEREIQLVNPKYSDIDGRVCHGSVDDLPEVPDVAVVATPARSVPGLAATLAGRGTAGIIAISAGFAERGADGRSLQKELLAASAGGLRIVGPNCLGVIAPHAGLNASFAHLDARPGRIAFLAQSGAIISCTIPEDCVAEARRHDVRADLLIAADAVSLRSRELFVVQILPTHSSAGPHRRMGHARRVLSPARLFATIGIECVGGCEACRMQIHETPRRAIPK